MITSKTCCFWS